MKTDLATSIGLAIVGVIVAYFVCDILVSNWFTGNYQIKALNTSVSADVTEPDIEIFNYQSLNPTVEVYVGDCQEYSSDGQCLDDNSEQNNNSEQNEQNQGNE